MLRNQLCKGIGTYGFMVINKKGFVKKTHKCIVGPLTALSKTISLEPFRKGELFWAVGDFLPLFFSTATFYSLSARDVFRLVDPD